MAKKAKGEGEEEAKSGGKGGGKMGVILIIVLLVVLLVAFVVGFFFIYKAMTSGDEPTIIEVQVDTALKMDEITPFVIGDGSAILTNLMTGPDGKSHVIKISTALGINTSKDAASDAAELMALLGVQTSAIKDVILGICRNKTYEELTIGDAKQILKSEILLELQDLFGTKLIVDVYIDDIYLD